MGVAAADLSGILTGTGFIAYLDRCRKEDMWQYDAIHEAASIVGAGIIRAGGGAAWAMGVDVRIISRRIRRSMEHAADLHDQAARALSATAGIYNATLGAPMVTRVDAKTFNPAK